MKVSLNYLSTMLTKRAREGTSTNTEKITLRIIAMAYTMFTRVFNYLGHARNEWALDSQGNCVGNIDKVIVSSECERERYDIEQTVNQPLVSTKSLCSSPSAEPQPGRQPDSSSLEQPGLSGAQTFESTH